MTSNGSLQHVSVELSGATVLVTVNIGTETKTGNIPLISPVSGVYNHTLKVELSSPITNVTLDPLDCHDPGLCRLSLKVTEYEAKWHLEDLLFVGGLPSLTPYQRSKLTTPQGYVGCLGVNLLKSYL